MKHDIKSKDKAQSSFSAHSQPNWKGIAEQGPHVSRKHAETPLSGGSCKQTAHLPSNWDAQSKDFPWRILTNRTLPSADRKSEAINTADVQKWSKVALERGHRLLPKLRIQFKKAETPVHCEKECMYVCVPTHMHHLSRRVTSENLGKPGHSENTVPSPGQGS